MRWLMALMHSCANCVHCSKTPVFVKFIKPDWDSWFWWCEECASYIGDYQAGLHSCARFEQRLGTDDLIFGPIPDAEYDLMMETLFPMEGK